MDQGAIVQFGLAVRGAELAKAQVESLGTVFKSTLATMLKETTGLQLQFKEAGLEISKVAVKAADMGGVLSAALKSAGISTEGLSAALRGVNAQLDAQLAKTMAIVAAERSRAEQMASIAGGRYFGNAIPGYGMIQPPGGPFNQVAYPVSGMAGGRHGSDIGSRMHAMMELESRGETDLINEQLGREGAAGWQAQSERLDRRGEARRLADSLEAKAARSLAIRESIRGTNEWNMMASAFRAEEMDSRYRGVGGVGAISGTAGAATSAAVGLKTLEKEAGFLSKSFGSIRIPHWLQGLAMQGGLPIYSGGAGSVVAGAGVVGVGLAAAMRDSQRTYEDNQTKFALMQKDLLSLGEDIGKISNAVATSRGIIESSVAWAQPLENVIATKFDIKSGLPQSVGFSEGQRRAVEKTAYKWGQDVTNAPVQDIADLIQTAAVNFAQFGDFAKDPEGTSKAISNALFTTQAIGKFDISQMTKHFGQMFPVARQMGWDITEILGATSAATAQTMKEGGDVQKAATSMRNLMTIIPERQGKGDFVKTGSFLGDVYANQSKIQEEIEKGDFQEQKIGRRNLTTFLGVYGAIQSGQGSEYVNQIRSAAINKRDIVSDIGTTLRADSVEQDLANMKETDKLKVEAAQLRSPRDPFGANNEFKYQNALAYQYENTPAHLQKWAWLKTQAAAIGDYLGMSQIVPVAKSLVTNTVRNIIKPPSYEDIETFGFWGRYQPLEYRATAFDEWAAKGALRGAADSDAGGNIEKAEQQKAMAMAFLEGKEGAGAWHLTAVQKKAAIRAEQKRARDEIEARADIQEYPATQGPYSEVGKQGYFQLIQSQDENRSSIDKNTHAAIVLSEAINKAIAVISGRPPQNSVTGPRGTVSRPVSSPARRPVPSITGA